MAKGPAQPISQNANSTRILSYSTSLCLLSLIFPLMSTVGWALKIPALRQIAPVLPAMQPNTIFGLLLSAAAIFLSREDRRFSKHPLFKDVLAAAVLLLGLVTLCEYVFDWNSGIDQFIFRSAENVVQPFPGRPSPQTSLNFLLLGFAILIFNHRLISISAGQISALLVGANSIIAATGIIFGTSHFYGFPFHIPSIGMAIHTSASFLLLAVALLFSRPKDGMMRIVTSDLQSSGIARKILFTAIAIPPLVGALTRIGVAAGWYDVGVQVSLFTVVVVGIILRTTWKATKQAEQAEIQVQALLEATTLANEQIRESQERFELALRGADLATWDWNIKTGEVQFNDRWAEMRGFRLAEVRSHVDTWTSGIHPDDLPRVQKSLSDYFEGVTREYSVELRVLTKSGKWIWILDRGSVFARDRDGKPTRMVGTELDINERKLLDQELRLAEARSSGIVSISADAIISVDENQHIILFNEGAEKIFGYSKDQALGATLDTLIPEGLRAMHHQLVNKFAHGEKISRRMGERGTTIFGRRKNGEEFPADAAISKLNVGGKRILTVALRDVTEQNRIEKELKLFAEKAQTETKAREDVLAIVSHDLKNPLASISLAAQLLQGLDEPNLPQIHEFAARMQHSVGQMQRLIGDLLDFGKIQAGAFSVEKKNEDIQKIIFPIVEIMRIQAEAKRQRFEIEISADLPPIACDAVRIGQVLSNLIGNAIKFTPEGGTVRLLATPCERGILFSICDTGPGIPPEQLPMVFDRFWQASETKHLGSGLGLAISKGIIESHGGKIWAETEAGKGTCFSFTLSQATGDKQLPRAGLEGIHIMLVDDSPDMLSLLGHILANAGASVTPTASATEALLKIAEERPNLIITDIEMPECDGYGLIGKIHEMTKSSLSIPLIALTAHTDTAAIKKIANAGFAAYLSKPIQANTLISSIRELFL